MCGAVRKIVGVSLIAVGIIAFVKPKILPLKIRQVLGVNIGDAPT